MSSRYQRKKLQALERASYVDQRRMEATSFWVRNYYKLRRQFLRYYFVQPPQWRVLRRSLSRAERMEIGFASLGAVRSGTSLLSDYLMQHPNVVLPLAKEIGAGRFPTARLIRAQLPTRKEGQRLERKVGNVMTGYCSPAMTSLVFPYLASTIMGDAKLILILRNPVERTFAHWRWDQVLLSRVKDDPLWSKYPSFDEYVDIELDAIRSKSASGFAFLSGTHCGGYIQNSIYLPFMKEVWKHFSRSNTLIIQSEDFFRDPVATAKRAYSFLELPAYEPVELPVKNAAPSGHMALRTRERLQGFFEPLNAELSEYVGQSFDWT